MKKNNLKLDKIIWIDLEMTGLSPEKDLILEAAAIVTDWNFQELATYQGVVKNDEAIIRKRMKSNGAFWDANPESRDGLLAQNASGKSLKAVESDLLDIIDKNFDQDKPVLLGGNSIHMDRRFIEKNWPKLDKRLFYRMLDVSAWKVVAEYKYRKFFNKPDAHRALDDIRGSIEELKFYLGNMK